jgi:hypothetical protein
MRRAAPLVVAAALLVAPGAAAAKPCPKAGKTSFGSVHVVRGTQATLVNTYDESGGGLSVDSAICDRRDGDLITPSWTLPYDDLLAIDRHRTAFGGRYVAYAWEDSDGDGQYAGIEVVDVWSRAKVGMETVADLDRVVDGPVVPYSKVAVRSSGTTAWASSAGVFVAVLPSAGERATVRRIGRPDRLRPRTLRATPRGFCWRARDKQRCERLR